MKGEDEHKEANHQEATEVEEMKKLRTKMLKTWKYFLEERPQIAMPSISDSDSDESITFPNHVIAQGCCLANSPRPQGVVAVPSTDKPL